MEQRTSLSKRILSIMLSLMMVLSLLSLPSGVFGIDFGLKASAESGSSATGVTFKAISGNPAGLSNEGYANLLDNDTSTKWCCNYSGSAYVVIEASERIRVSGYTVTTGNDTSDFTGRNPKTWTLSASNDNSTWVEIAKVGDGKLPAEDTKAVPFSITETTEYYQYFKLDITQIEGGDIMQISEFALTYTTCEHQWESTDRTIEPTCTEGGYDVYECSICGSEKNVPNDNPATEHEKGEDGKCTNCGAYMISNADELKTFTEAVKGGEWSANAVLTANITVNENVLKDDGTLADDVSGFTVWTPIGSYKYTGAFDGQGFAISGLYASDADTSIFGLFGYVEGGSISNVCVVDSYFSGNQHIGGICGSNNGGTITNCHNASTVIGSYSGGICGTNKGTITNCSNAGVVGAENSSVGGICGYNQDATVTNCSNSGKVNGKGWVGGISGYSNAIITDCHNTGTVNGTGSSVGGVCGNNSGGTITNGYNTGTVTGGESSANVGGVCGYINGGTVTNSYNQGLVSGKDKVGGVCGRNGGTTANCYNIGSVTGVESSANIGGVCGYNSSGTTKNCYNTGTVTGGESSTNIGGLCGYNSSGSFSNCYYLADSETDSIDGTVFKTAKQFASGEVAYLLQGDQTEAVWGQDLSQENTYPVLDGAKRVYRNNAYAGCGGSPDAPIYSYANEKTDPDFTEHNYNNGFCTACGDCKPATDADEDGCYEIGNAGQLYWFANKVNTDNENYNNANAVLTADITVNKDVLTANGELNSGSFTAWTPIGWYDYENYTNCSYNGIFDGQKHTVSGLYFNDESAKDVGLFGYVENGSISNVGIVDSYFKGGEFVGGVCGTNSGTIKNCYNTSAVSGTDFVGGVCGTNSGTIKNCYNTGAVSGTDKVGSIYGINDDGAVTNCYYLGDTATAGIGSGSIASKTVAQFANGEVAYLLSQGTDGDVWGQDLSKDSYPVLGGAKVYQAYRGCTGAPGDPQAYSNENKSAVDKEHRYNKGLCTVCGTYDPATDSDGNGYYEIGNAGQLYWFAAQVNSGNNGINAVLTADITVNEDVLTANGALNGDSFTSWTPIGNAANPYNGTFNGQGRTVSGLCLNDNAANNIGLFGYVGENGSISNVGVLDSYFVGNDSVGGVCGYNKGTVTGCYAICSADAMEYYVGGVCGSNNGTITNCCSNNINPSRNAAIGYDDSESTANVSAKSTAQFASGEVAYILNGSTSEGSLVWGQTLGGEAANAYPITHTDKNTVYATTGCVSYNNNGDTSAQEHHYDSGKCTVCGKYTEPNKDENGVYQISNATELYWFADAVNSGNSSVNAVLTNNITVNKDVLKNDGTLADDVSGFTSWTPIGYYNSDSDCCFYTGIFDGAGHTISGLYLNDKDAVYVGLFACVGEGGAVLNVGVVDSYFQGEYCVGGLCGVNFGGNFTNCYNAGVIIGTSENAGGLCGVNANGTMTNCYNIGTVTAAGEHGYAGGVCGLNGNGTITNCYNAGAVTATGNSGSAGGLCGVNYSGKITNCYNTGAVTVTGTNGIAGAVCTSNHGGTITNCYYLAAEETDSFDGTTFKNAKQFTSGEVCYQLNGGKTSGAIWYQNIVGETADKSPVFDSSHGIVYRSLCTGEYANENIGHTVIGDYDSKGFGVCSVCGENIFEPAIQNESGVYEIYNVGQLYWFAQAVNNGNTSINAVLKDDITVNANVLKENGTLADDVSGFTSWTPIGYYNDDSDYCLYTGRFDGAGHTISGLYFDDASAYDVGLFGLVGEKGVVTDVCIAYSYINADEYVGGICGENYGEVINCSNSGTVNGTRAIGGVCGYNEGEFTNCNNKGTVSGSENVGGVCGYNDGGTITNCNNEGKISGSNDVGGLCGYSNGTIDNCINTGKVEGAGDSDDVGGVCGENRGTIKNSNNKGSVSGADFVGGVCGYNWGGKLENCTNEGELSGTDWIGGVCGKNTDKGEIKDCHNEGVISGTGNNIGGVCGTNCGTMTNCNNSGSVSGTVTGSNAYIFVGGVCGYNDGGTITSCYNTGTVTAKNEDAYAGGVCGNNEGTVTNCYNSGSVNGTSVVGGVCGYNWEGITANCYNTGTVTTANEDAYVGGVCGKNYNGTVSNCYYLAAEETDEFDGTTFKIASQFNSGEVAYLLSQGCTIGEGESAVTYNGSVWGQNIDNGDPAEQYPVLSGKNVYNAFVYEKCACNPGEPTGSVYSNKEAVYANHNMTHFEKNDATCTEKGNEEYWICSNDDSIYYKDENGTEKYADDKDIIIPATGHKDDDGDYLCDICGDIMESAVAVSAQMAKGAAIRLSPANGLRFITVFDSAKIAELQAKGATVELGTLIAPKDLLGDDDLTFDLDESKYINVKYEATDDSGAYSWHNGENGTIAGSIVNIKESGTTFSAENGNIARDYVGRGYVKVTLGGKTVITYADYADGDIANNTRSVAYVANALKNDTAVYSALDDEIKSRVEAWASKLTNE